MRARALLVEAFATPPHRGNPAAVHILDSTLPAAAMQAQAARHGLPATVFVRPAGEAFALRWFSPAAELAFCGHGTLAAAHALWETAHAAGGGEVRFTTARGPLSATSVDGWIGVDLPAEPATAQAPPDGLLAALGTTAVWTGRNALDWLVEVASEGQVRALAPDLTALAAIDARGVIVTARSGTGGADVVSRFFAPRVGIPEDAVTGSAHCCLAPYWAPRLGRRTLVGVQASARGGLLRMQPHGARVVLSGQARTVGVLGSAGAGQPPET